MKIQKQSHKPTKRTILIISAAIILFGVVYAGTAKAMSWWPFAAQPTQNVAAENVNNGDEEKETDTPTKPSETPVDTPKTPSKDGDYSEEPTKEEAGAALRITKLNQADGNVNVTAAVNGADAGGRCIVYLTSKPEGSAVSKYMTATKNGSEITCTVSIDELEFSYLGTWDARVVYTTPKNTKVQSTNSLEIK